MEYDMKISKCLSDRRTKLKNIRSWRLLFGLNLLGDRVVELLRLQRWVERALHNRNIEPIGFRALKKAACHAAYILVGYRTIEQRDPLSLCRGMRHCEGDGAEQCCT